MGPTLDGFDGGPLEPMELEGIASPVRARRLPTNSDISDADDQAERDEVRAGLQELREMVICQPG